MVISKKLSFSKILEGVQHFPGGGGGGGGALLLCWSPIVYPYRTCDVPKGPDPLPPSGSVHEANNKGVH